jgi:HlyD family secretion protein
MTRRTKITLTAITLVSISALVVVVKASRGDGRDESIRTVAVERSAIVDKALAVGRIEPEIEVSVKSQISGVVARLLADEGDFVRAGDPLLEIKPNPTPLELADARRQLELRQIELDNLRRDLERQQALQSQGLVSEREFQETEQQYAERHVQHQMAQERLALLEEGKLTVADEEMETVVRSPIDGFILEKTVEVGDPVVPLSTYQEGTVLMSMAEMDKLLFRGTVDEIDVGRLQEGMPVEIKIGALPDARILGELMRISLKARTEDNSTVFPVDIALTDFGGIPLRAGYSANADIIIDRRDSVLTIPERLIDVVDDTARVTVLLPDGTTEERIIERGLSDAINLEVQSGLREGELVVEPPPREIS